MTTAARPSFPKTVSACHAEIIKLRSAVDEPGADAGRVEELEIEVARLKETLSATEDENDALEDRINELGGDKALDAIGAINTFLYEVERPVGRFNFDIIHGPAADRAIVGLFDAVRRQP